MRRRLLGTFAWFFLLFVAGAGRFAWLTARAVASRPRALLLLGGIVVALRTSNLLTAQLSMDAVWPLGHGIAFGAALLFGAVILFHGARSPWVWRVRRGLRQRGW